MYFSITSPQNQQFKRWKKLLSKKGRQTEGAYLAEGVHLLQEALTAKGEIRSIIIREGFVDSEKWIEANQAHTPVYQLSAPIFSKLIDTESPQGVLTEVTIPHWDIETQLKESNLILLLDEIQDPGNLGTILRTASATGVDLVVLGKGTVDPYNSKVIRSTMGAVFHLPILEADLLEVIPMLRQKNITVVGTSPHNGVYSFDYLFPTRVAIVLGNEGRGIQEAVLQQIDQALMVPMVGRAESYNVSITAGILLYEQLRQHHHLKMNEPKI
ncbi:RNA methyltransferase [Shimazuella sp. AN120528]|uniref:TrmH family RNA methyltransferase n=1 Tax=Shimazuella soli TaxID=1892854 RepID=UPI001F10D721|nr:RNA methyltransferase [Shimazuella soli]MCH5584479.1 RNA methyltransferase [Shimazuella soli]